MITDYYRLKAEEFINKLSQAQSLIVHNPSRGYVGEELLRDFLRSSLPSAAGVTQGFILHNNKLSPQCDIIIYKRLEYAPFFSFGNIEIIPSQSVYSVIEIKTNINRVGFEKFLQDCHLLHNMNVHSKILFLYNSPSVKTIENFFYPKCLEESDEPFIINPTPLYDHDNYGELPDTILSLHPNMYLEKGHFQDRKNDYNGYMDFEADDIANKSISCIQRLLQDLTDLINPENETYSYLSDNSIKKIKLNNGFGLYPL